jgi:hypothetical protein
MKASEDREKGQRQRSRDSDGEERRGQGCTGKAPGAEMSGSRKAGNWRPKTLICGGGDMEDDILREERGRREDGGEKNRKAARKEGRVSEGR